MADQIVLAIETSCDETAVAVIKNGREVLADVVYTQMQIFRDYGGVVPEIASRKHVEYLQPCLDEALKLAGITYQDIDAVGVTCGPGLVGALLTGVSCGKALAYAIGKPLVGVNHIEGHVCANYLTYPDLKPPFFCLIISGGHTHLVNVEEYGSYRLLGKTRDDAVGEVYDKVARMLGLSYPGGPNVERLALDGNAIYDFPVGLKGQSGFEFSFSGLKTAVRNQIHQLEQSGQGYAKGDIASSFQQAVCKALTKNAVGACLHYGSNRLALAGGVSCNMAIRHALAKECRKNHIQLFMPEKKWCTDNAAMIGCAAYYRLLLGDSSDLRLNAYPSMKIC